VAGIGFRLREIVTRNTFTEWVQLYVYAAVIFAGPWLMSILCLAALSVFAMPDLQTDGVALFTITTVYCYAFSLITTGVIQLPVTRYVADRLYEKSPGAVTPSFVGVVILVAPIQALTAAAFLAFCELTLAFKVSAMALYVVISIIWMAMIYLSAAKDYNALVLGFAVGYLTSFVAGRYMGELMGVEGTLSGFLLGQTVLCFWLIWRIFQEFPNTVAFELNFTATFSQYPHLAWAGLFYAVAIWIDKLLFWFGASGIRVHSLFYTHFPYDSAMFFGYLTIVPSLALFLVRIETEFYSRYKAYFGGILNRLPLADIEQRRAEMVDNLRRSLGSVLIYQGAFTVCVLVLLPWLLDIAGIDPAHASLFRVACVGCVFHAILLVLMVVLLYFDFRRIVMWLSALFMVTNGLFTYITLDNPELFGWGYLVSTLVTLIVSVGVLWNRLDNLEFVTFVQQPITQQKIITR
jgi:uncharacterized membrane protein